MDTLSLRRFRDDAQDPISDTLADFYDREDIIAKIHAIHEAERRRPYGSFVTSRPYWERIQTALTAIPSNHHLAALALFANAIYITDDLLREAMRTIASEVTTWVHGHEFRIPGDLHIFTNDHPGLIDQIFDAGAPFGWMGRLDNVSNRVIRLVTQLIDPLLELIDRPTPKRFDIRGVLAKPVWLLLTDNVLSGGSLVSDLARLQELAELFSDDPKPQIIAGTQVITELALASIRDIIPKERLFFGLYFDDQFRVTSERCALFNSAETLIAVRELCSWFGETYFPSQLRLPLSDGSSRTQRAAIVGNDPLAATVTEHRRMGGNPNYAYGWRDSGLTLVMERNTPTNSLPMLYYPVMNTQLTLDQNTYIAPFPRNHSRVVSRTAGDGQKMEQIRSNRDRIMLNLRES